MRVRSAAAVATQSGALALGALALAALLLTAFLLGVGAPSAQAAALPRAPQPAPDSSPASSPEGAPLALTVVKTIGVDPGSCATDAYLLVEPGTTVYYCFTVVNNQPATLITHDVVDSQLGPIVTNLFLEVPVGTSTFITRSHTATANATNTVTWTAFTQQEATVAGTATATLEVGEAALTVTKLIAASDTCAGSASLTVPNGANVWYCIQITNSGDFTFTQHAIQDPQLEIDVLIEQQLAPGATVTLSNDQIPALGPVVVTEAITNVVTVTSNNEPLVPPVTFAPAAVAPVSVSSTAQSVVEISDPTNDGEVDEPGGNIYLPIGMR